MQKDLWDKILAFDLDHPISEYGFSTRLANENYWTRNFTKKAIIEYKKFMYLAATSDLMVSPSEIIDVVWHQHLIFTQSYQIFCGLLKKQIQHVPSTHNREDFLKFKQAKERTKQQYKITFGEQPAEIWSFSGMYEALELPKAKLKIRTFIILGIFAFAALLVPAYFTLKPIYARIPNPHFLWIFLAVAGIIFLCLEIYNRFYLINIIKNANRSSFLFDLHPMEVVYMQSQKFYNVVNGFLNPLIADKTVIVSSAARSETETVHSW